MIPIDRNTLPGDLDSRPGVLKPLKPPVGKFGFRAQRAQVKGEREELMMIYRTCCCVPQIFFDLELC